MKRTLHYKYQTPKHPECFISRVESMKYPTSFTPLVQVSNQTGLPSELIVAYGFLARLDEDALHGAPPVVLVGRSHGVHLALTPDGVSILLPCHTQINVGAHVFEAHVFFSLPVVTVTLHCPDVEVVPFAIVAERADFLLTIRCTFKTAGFVQWSVWVKVVENVESTQSSKL